MLIKEKGKTKNFTQIMGKWAARTGAKAGIIILIQVFSKIMIHPFVSKCIPDLIKLYGIYKLII